MSDSKQAPDYRALLKRAMGALDEMQAKVAKLEGNQHEAIAVVGMGCRFPGDGVTPDAFWEFLCSGQDAVTEIPKDRWDLDSMYDPDPNAPGKSYTRWGAFLKDVDQFDPQFFGNAPREAISMDPQQRLLLEVAWESLEHAGLAADSLAGSKSGVFVGMTGKDYADLVLQANDMTQVDAYFGSGISQSIAAGRLAYTFDFLGPAIAIDTACSSSLVATHMACQSLRAGECDLALGGGVNLMLSPGGHISTSRAKMMSFEGRCKTFDAAADGYVRAEGCSLLVLKRLSDAQRDGDRILAVIRGTAINQDGRSNGLTAPNSNAQEAVIRAALKDGGVNPAHVDYIETHGTGTTLGDPIEIRALDAVFSKHRSADHPLRIGSVKTNVGHLEAAAGIVGLCKLILALDRGEIPPHLHLKEPNPYIPWDEIPIEVPVERTRWAQPEGRRRLGAISSFGFSGTNSHMIVEQAPAEIADAGARVQNGDPDPRRVYTISAKNDDALRQNARRHAEHLRASTDRWDDLAYTATHGRVAFDERLAFVADSAQQASELLSDWAEDGSGPVQRGVRLRPEAPELVFLFTGQGAQYPGMSKRLYQTEPVFRAALDECAAILKDELPASLLEIIHSADDPRIHDTQFTQPALFAVEYAVCQLWKSWGIQPTVVLGHSIGELAAACIAGVFSLEDGLRLIAARGRLMQRLPKEGGMAALFTDEATVVNWMASYGDDLSIAALNGPQNTVVSGRNEALEAIQATAKAEGVRATPLTVSHAFHSALMDPALDDLEDAASKVTYHEPELDLISNRTGQVAEEGLLTTARYWREQMRGAVRFAPSFATVAEMGHRVFVEVGPQPTLLGMARRCVEPEHAVWLPTLRKGRDDRESALQALASLFSEGCDPDWNGVAAAPRPKKVGLPTYAFQRSRYWHPLADPKKARRVDQVADGHPLLGRELDSPHVTGTLFATRLDIDQQSWVREHEIFKQPLLPATAYLEVFLAAANQVSGGQAAAVESVRIEEPMLFTGGTVRDLQTHFDPATDTLELHSRVPGESWIRHATAKVARSSSAPAAMDRQQITARCDQVIDPIQYYRVLDEMGVLYGPLFQGIASASRSDGAVVGSLKFDHGDATADGSFRAHPALVDAALQLLGLAMPAGGDLDPDAAHVYLPVGIDRCECSATLPDELDVVGVVEPDASGELFLADLEMRDANDRCVMRLSGMRFKKALRSALTPRNSGELPGDLFYRPRWVEAPLDSGDSRSGRLDPTGAWLCVGQPDDGLSRALQTAGVSATWLPAAQAWEDNSLEGVAHVVFDARFDDTLTMEQSVAKAEELTQQLVALLRLRARQPQPAALSVLTRDVWKVIDGDRAECWPLATLWGVGRVLASEQVEGAVRLVDLDRSTSAECVAVELGAPVVSPQQSAWREGRRYRLTLAREPRGQTSSQLPPTYRLEIRERGTLDGLELRPMPLAPPAAGQVQLAVAATGLNFRDVLNVLDQYQGEADSLGSECAGVVTAVGEGVTRVAIGDRVVAATDRSFASHAVALEALTARIPDSMRFDAAATIPMTFLTAAYALENLGQMKSGESVLIHAGAGGVGLAAIQLARRAGLRVFATAGTETKRRFLLEQGVEAAFDSRHADFVEPIRQLTGGRGVNLVLNSLTGAFIEDSVKLLADRGRFLEIGKAGIWEPERFKKARPDATYHVIFLGQVCLDEPQVVQELLDRLMIEFESGTLQPLLQRRFSIEEAADAFRHMAQARHVGKVVLTHPHTPESLRLRPDGTYLITGGTGGLGLAVAEHLVERGAERLVLAARSQPSEEAQRKIDALIRLGSQVEVAAVDIADPKAVREMIENIPSDDAPLRGVFHTAGVLADGVLRDMSDEQLDQAMRPKLRGAWNLHEATASHRLDHFVLFSAGAVLFGAPGQGNYAAGNAALDALAQWRRASGLPANSINWGPWSGVGMAARLGEDALRRWESQGLASLTVDQGVAALWHVMELDAVQSAPLPIRWPSLLHFFSKHGVPPIMSDLAREETKKSVRTVGATLGRSLADELGEQPEERRHEWLSKRLKEQILQVLGLDASVRVSPQQGLTDLGMDSLMAVELSNRLGAWVDQSLPSTLAFEYPTLEELTVYIEGLIGPPAEPESTSEGDTAPQEAAEDLTEDELEAELLRELDKTGY